MAVAAFSMPVLAQGKAEIKFDKTTHNFGTFKEADSNVTCTFKFTNTGDAPLVIEQAVASCGCTTPVYPKQPIAPGATGEIKVTYKGAGKFPGVFKKTITLVMGETKSNSVQEVNSCDLANDIFILKDFFILAY